MSLALAPFPYDVLVHIVSLTPRDTWTTLCVVCRDFHQLSAPHLYRVADFGFTDAVAAHQFLKTVSSSRHLGSFVSRLSIRGLLDEALPVFVPALRNMPNVQHFHCRRLGTVSLHDPAVFDLLAGLQSLRSFEAIWSGKYDLNQLLDRLPPLQSIDIDPDGNRMDALERLLLRSRETLQSLATRDWELETFLQGNGRGFVWPNMTRLFVFDLDSTSPLEAFVNLEVIRVSLNWVRPIHVLGDSAFLPRLRQLGIVAYPRPENIDRSKRRELPHLNVQVLSESMLGAVLTAADLLDFMAAFSWQHLLSLQFVTDCPMVKCILEILPALLPECINLRLIAFLKVSINNFSRILDALTEQTSARLPELRYVVHTNAWQLEDQDETEVASALGVIESRVSPLFECFPRLRILQSQVSDGEMNVSWGRRLSDVGHSSGGVRMSGRVDKLPTGIADVAEFLDSKID